MKRFPCLEQPVKCYLNYFTSDGGLYGDDALLEDGENGQREDPSGISRTSQIGSLRARRQQRQRLSVVKKNRREFGLALTPHRVNRAAFWILPCKVDPSYALLKSCQHENAYLRVVAGASGGDADADAVAAAPLAEDLEFYQWKLVRSKHARNSPDNVQQQDGDGSSSFAIRSFHGKTLTTTTDGQAVSFCVVPDDKTKSQFDLELLSGELLFLSASSPAPAVDGLTPESNPLHVRCDVLGQVSLTETMKGWEVWRFIECGSSGKVKINSWMHDTRYLSIFDEEGGDDGGGNGGGDRRVSAIRRRVGTTAKAEEAVEWIVELSNEARDGVTLRTESGWFLALQQPPPVAAADGSSPLSSSMTAATAQASTESNGGVEGGQGSGKKQPHPLLTAVQCNPRGEATEDQATVVAWQLDAAHSQQYSLMAEDGVSTVGPFPNVTRKAADSFRIERTAEPDTVTLELRNQYVSVTAEEEEAKNAVITLADVPYEWKMTVNGEDGSYTFQALAASGTDAVTNGDDGTATSLYLSTMTITKTAATATSGNGDEDKASSQAEQQTTDDEPTKQSSTSSSSSTPAATLSNRFRSMVAKYKKPESFVVLALSETPHCWRLDPCMPRAISSNKIKTFAAGTTLAIATTVAMPFAIAGVVGVIGAEMGLLANVVAATLTGVEAAASVGVVGATAAICFRQDADTLSNRLEDSDMGDDEACAEDGGSVKRYPQRPFCDWNMWDFY